MDDLGNSETSYFVPTTPKEQKQEEQQERATMKAGLPVIEELLERLTQRAKFYDTLNSIPDDVEVNPEVHLRTVLINKQTKANLEEELHYWQTMYDTYSK